MRYLIEENIFIDENNMIIPSVDDICAWYFSNVIKINTSNTFNRISQHKCKILFEMIRAHCMNEEIKVSAHNDCNFLFTVIKHKLFDQNKENIYLKAFMPISKNQTCAGYVHFLLKSNEIIEMPIQMKAASITTEIKEYYRLKIGLLYYLLNLEKEIGYVMSVSFKNAVKITKIKNIYNNKRCETIIKDYLSQNKRRKFKKIGKADTNSEQKQLPCYEPKKSFYVNIKAVIDVAP